MKVAGIESSEEDQVLRMGHSLTYNRTVGNSYSASLYFGLASLLDNDPEDLAGQRIGLFSYGSGCVGEFFTGVVGQDYRQALYTEVHQTLLAARKPLDFTQYLSFYKQFSDVERCENITIDHHTTGRFRLAAIQGHKRIYADQQRQE